MIAAVEALDGGSLFMFTDAAALDESRTGELLTKGLNLPRPHLLSAADHTQSGR